MLQLLDGNQILPLHQHSQILFQLLCRIFFNPRTGTQQAQHLSFIELKMHFLIFTIKNSHDSSVLQGISGGEVSRFLFLYLVYFAASLAASKNLHIRVTAQLKLLPKLGQMLLLLATDIIWLIFCIIVVDVGTDFIISMSDRPMVSGALMLDMRYVYAAVPIAFTLQAVRLVERWWRIFTKRDPLVVPSEEVF